jgi:pSer/pThr/pTyr-binding forkhead associated (FHA) protein
MERNLLFEKNKIIAMSIILIISLFVIGCVSTQVSSIELFDNNILMIKPYVILSNDLVRIELAQLETNMATSFSTPETRTVHDRILERAKELYPGTDAVLIASLEAVKKSTTEYVAGTTTSEYTYVAIVYPIKYQ